MNFRPLLLLPLLLLLAFSARWEPARVLQLDAGERDLGASRWLIDDPETCEHMRRIELGIAAERVPEFDAFVNHPAGGEIPALPVYDTVVAGLAQRFLDARHGETALGGIDEAELEDFAARFGPLLGCLATLAVFAAARALLDGPRRDALALGAALVFALHPAAVGASSAGHLDSMSLAALLLALLVRSTARALRSTARPAIVLDALIAGVIAGLLAATTAAGIFAFVPTWLGFLRLAFRGPEERHADAVRGGLLFCAVSSFVSSLPRARGPWEAEPGAIVANFTAGVSMLLFFAAAPFLVALLFKKGEKPRVFRIASFLAALVLMAWQVPQVWSDMRPALAWLLDGRGAIATVMPGLRSRQLTWSDSTALAFQALTFLPAWVFLIRREPSADRVALLSLGFLTFLLSVVFVGTTPLFVVALACTLAAALGETLAVPRTSRIALAASAAFLAILAAQSLAPYLEKPDLAQREERIAFVAGLRWMRANTPAGSAWNSPRMKSDWGVLSSVSDGALVEYHARRPAVTSPNAALSGLDRLREAGRALGDDSSRSGFSLASSSIEPLLRFMRSNSAKYLVATRARHHQLRELSSSAPGAGFLSTLGADLPPLPGIERIHASQRRIDIEGHAPRENALGGPAISIYKLADSAAPATHEAEMRAR